MNRFLEIIEEEGFTPAGFFGGLFVFLLFGGLFVYGFCLFGAEVERERRERSEAIVSRTPFATTFRQDGHWFIKGDYGAPTHHPDCPCQK